MITRICSGICPATVFNWVKKSTKITKEFTGKLKPKTKNLNIISVMEYY